MKNQKLVILTAVLLVAMASALAFAPVEEVDADDADTVTVSLGSKVTATIDKMTGHVEITGEGAMSGFSSSTYPFKNYVDCVKTVTIGDGVTSIGNYVFEYCTSLTSVTIPDSVTTIGNYAFGYCSSLTSVTIPDSVTSTGTYAFRNCTSLQSVTIGATSIGNYTFYSCTALESVTITDSVTSVGQRAFYGCTSLTSVTIPNSVTKIDTAAFYNCTSLQSVTIGSGVTSIVVGSNTNSFYGCTSLKSIVVDSDNMMYTSDDQGILYDKDKTTLYLCPAALEGDLEIPSSVTSIGGYAFYKCASLTSVTIPDSVTSIGDYVFYGCASLTSVTIPDSVTSFGTYAFYDCTSLESVTIGTGIASISNHAFRGCTSLTSVTIPDSVTSIGERAFYGCTSLTSVVIPDGVTTISTLAFSGCTSLETVSIGAGVTSITVGSTSGSFYNCASLKSIVVDSDNTKYSSDDQGILYDKSKTTLYLYPLALEGELEIPDSVTSIGAYAFYNCTSLTSVTIPSSVTSFGTYAFSGCTSLTSVTIPSSVTSFGTYAFSGCTSLTSVTFGSGMTSIGNYAFKGCTSLTSVTIPGSVTSFGTYVFQNCTSLTSVTIGSGVTSFGTYTFHGCTSLESVTIPDSVTSIGAYAFYGCTSLGSVAIPDSVTSIGAYAFYGCTSLGSVAIPDKVTSVGSYAFSGCTSLESVTIPDNVTSLGTYAFSGCTSLEDITIGSGVTSIGNYAFQNCISLTSVAIPDSVTSLGTYAFSGCTSLESVTIGSGVTSIGNYAFRNCTSLEDVTIGSGVTSISTHAFSGCTSLMSVTIPAGVTSVHSQAFEGCTALKTITVDSANTSYSSDDQGILYDADKTTLILCPNGFTGGLEISSGVTSVGDYAFSGCTSLTSVTIPDSVTSIGDYAFYGCASLMSVTIPDGVTSIGTYVFSGCTSLESVTIGSGVTSIGNYAFRGCTSLMYISIPEGVTSIGNYAFYGCTLLRTVEINGDGTSFGTHAFYGCGSLTVKLSGSVADVSQLALSDAYSLYRLEWGDESTKDDLTISSELSGVSEISVRTTGTVTISGVTFSNLTSLTVECGKLVVTGTMSSDSEYSVEITSDSIEGEEFIGGNVTGISVSGDAATGLLVGDLLADGTYNITSVTLNGEAVDVAEGITGHKLTVTDSDGNELTAGVLSVIKSGGSYSAVFAVEYDGLPADDLNAFIGDSQLAASGDGFLVGLDEDATVVISEKSAEGAVYTVTFVANGGEFENGSALEIAEGRTISSSALDSMEPTRDGYEFVAWYTDSGLSAEYVRGAVTSDMTLYARWILLDGCKVTVVDEYGLIDATYSDGTTFYSGDLVEEGAVLTFVFEESAGFEFLGWTVKADGAVTEYEGGTLTVTISADTVIGSSFRVYSTSTGLIKITNLPTPEAENVILIWECKNDVNTSMAVWSGTPSVPLIVDDYVYVRAGYTLMKLSIHTGDILASVTLSTQNSAFYHYLGYGAGVVIDYLSQSAYDLDLNYLYELPMKFTAVYYIDGYFFGLYDGKLWKFDPDDGSLVTDEVWADGVTVGWYTQYGTTSTPVIDGEWLYYLESDGDDRFINAINTVTGETDRMSLNAMSGYRWDDGELTMYEYNGVKYMFVSGYGSGLFESGTITSSIVDCISLNDDGTFNEGSERWMLFNASGSASSAFVVVDGRGYINLSGTETVLTESSGGAFYVIDADKFLDVSQDLWTYHADQVTIDLTYTDTTVEGIECGGYIIYIENSVGSHGSIVVSTAYKDSTGKVYIYLLPYSSSEQGVYIFTDWEGKTEASGYVYTSLGTNYGSQAVHVGPNGELIFYTDSGSLYCVMAVSGMSYSFLIQDEDGAQWVEASGMSMQDALVDALEEFYSGTKTIALSDGVFTVDGEPLSVYIESGAAWESIDCTDTGYSSYRTFFVSLSILTDAGGCIDADDAQAIYCQYDGGAVYYDLCDLMNDPSISGYLSRVADVESIDMEGTMDLVVGETATLTAEVSPSDAYPYVTWSSSDESVATVVDGVVTALAEGTAVITATAADGSGVYATCTVTVETVPVESIVLDSETMTLDVGDSITLTATVSPDNATDATVVWSSSDESVATVVDGVVTAIAEGIVVITATAADGSGAYAECTVTVTIPVESIVLDSETATLEVGESITLTADVSPSDATDTAVVWSSSDEAVAIVVDGVVIAVGAGTATITATAADGSGVFAECEVTATISVESITISRTTMSMDVGGSITLAVTVSPDNATVTALKWTSSNTSVATVVDGVVTAVGAGTATITATATDGSGATATCRVTVAGESGDTPGGSGTTTETEETVVDGSTVSKVTETTTSSDGTVTTSVTYTVSTDGSDVTTTVTVEADGSTSVDVDVPSTVTGGTAVVSAADMAVVAEQVSALREAGADVSSAVTVGVSGSAESMSVSVPSDLLSELSDTGVSLVSGDVSLTLSGDVLSALSGDAVVGATALSGSDVPSALDGMTVLAVYDLSLTVDGSSVHTLGGTATLTVPVQLGSGQSSENVKAYYVADDGTLTLVDGSYDSATKTLSIQTGHFSVFAVVYEEPSSDDGDSTLLYVAIAVVVIVVVIAVAALYMRGRAGRA